MAAIFVINLARSTNRLIQTTARLSSVNLEFKRIDAIDGNDLNVKQKYLHYSPQLNKQKYHYALNNGQIGCYLSHRKAWQKIVDEKLQYAIVLEDDFYIDESIHDAIKNIEQLKQPWQLIKLAAYENRTRPIAYQHSLNNHQQLVIHKKLMSGCCATAISYEGAKQLLESTEQFGRPVDCDLQHIWETQVNGFSLMPYPIKQDANIKSDIGSCANKTSVKKAFLRRKRQQIKSCFLNKVYTSAFVRRTKVVEHNKKGTSKAPDLVTHNS
ncbi:glycosyltransferase family 25 protein [Pseudoalteromonas distincta]|uniref:glycosyltransferase family 25 protein n=1 Tax=Pseudoalteromonas distincta TaxID=77608 RepID=UPI0032E31177